MALQSYAARQDYEELYGADETLAGEDLDRVLWQASRDADRLTLGRIEAAGGAEALPERAAELVSRAVCIQANWLLEEGSAWRQGLKQYDVGGVSMTFEGTAAQDCGICTGMRELLLLSGLCCRGVGP